MLSKNQIKLINSLKINKYRKLHQQFIAEGGKLILDLMGSTYKIELVFALKEWVDENYHMLLSNNIEIIPVSPVEMSRISGLSTAGPVLAIVNIPGQFHIEDLLFNELVLVLDHISDPGNMGTIIRIADWFGLSTIICSPECVDIYNPKVVQASMGSIARVNIITHDLLQLMQLTPQDFPVYGGLLEGDSLSEITNVTKGLVVIGNESKGISPHIKPYISHPIRIAPFPNDKRPKAESLNAAVAAAIILYEFRRK